MNEKKLVPITLELLNEYSVEQESLILNLISLHGDISEVPMSGFLNDNGAIWQFKRHGLGVRFVCQSSNKVIDAHVIRLDYPRSFDAWSIVQYIESLGGEDISRKSVEKELRELCGEGKIYLNNESNYYLL
jgi:hypothetical protein